ncbi:MAG: hypothetical protein KGZ85_07920 [Ignavibacterium sp.]|nr:hypothetical protein [Ignavibacterium sp.]
MQQEFFRIKLETAKQIATELVDILSPHCERIEVAGSVRRKKPDVKDIELIIIPKVEVEFSGLFNDEENLFYPLDRFILGDDRFDFRLNKNGHRMYGEKNKLIIYHPAPGVNIPVDIFAANDENFMMVKFVRTGGAENNLQVARKANSLGMNLRIYESCFEDKRGYKYRMNSEEQIYKFLELPYLKAEERK